MINNVSLIVVEWFLSLNKCVDRFNHVLTKVFILAKFFLTSYPFPYRTFQFILTG